jgi:hypothetical protein
MKKLIPLALLAILQIVDVASTNRALAVPGVQEVNPLMVWAQQELGSCWWLPKLAILVFLTFVVVRLPPIRARWLMAGVLGLYVVVVANNLSYFLS